MWPPSVIESICEVLGDTETGFTGSEIGRLLARVKVPDVDPSASKRLRLANALITQQ